MRSMLTSLSAAAVVLSVAGAASAYIDLDSKVSTHNDAWGWCITRTYKVIATSTVGHDPGTCWYVSRLCGVSVREHSTNRVATANVDLPLDPPDWMGMSALTAPDNVNISMAAHSFVVPQSMFDDPDGILSGDFFLQSSGVDGINVPPILGVHLPYEGAFEAGFNFSLGEGLFIGQQDPEYSPDVDGDVLLLPAPGAVAGLGLLAVAFSRRRR